MEKKKAGPLLYSIFILFSVVPLFYLPYTHRPFYYPKFFLISLGLLSLVIYAISNKIEIVFYKIFLLPVLFFVPFFIRWFFTPFPLFSLFYTTFYLSYLLFLMILFSFDDKFYINKKIIIWMWIVVVQIFSLIINLAWLKVSFIISTIKKLGLLSFLYYNGRDISLLGGNPNFSAEFLTFSFIAFLIIFFIKDFKVSQSIFLDFVLKILFLINIFLTIVLLSSRASFISLSIGIFMLIVFFIRNNKLYSFIFIAMILIIFLMIMVPSFRSHLPSKLQSIVNPKKLIYDMRFRFFHWKIAYFMGLENPLFGKGPGMFRVYVPKVAEKLKKEIDLTVLGYLFDKNGKPLFPTNAHNDLLEFWAEGGIFLVLYFISLFFYLPWVFLNGELISIVPIFILFFNSLFSFPFHIPLILTFIGLYLYIIKDRKGLDAYFSRLLSINLKYVILFLSTLFFVLSFNFLLSDLYLYEGKNLKSIKILERSAKLNPVEPNVWEFLYNTAIDKKMSVEKKISYFYPYLKLVDSPILRYKFAILLREKGEFKEAIENLKMAIFLWSTHPMVPLWYHKIGYYYYKLNDLKKAITYTKKSIEKNKSDDELKIDSYINLFVFYREKKDYKSALKMAIEAQKLINDLSKKVELEKYKKIKEGLKEFIEKFGKTL